ncbi:primase-helicase zinc-binding domain-containing protein [Desulfovibrio desulfuricans]|uniref:primase-helicase zinc-binding domain-containing protein n=1 Tax=Desulfovibrio desulfuricans TaxID=876 RepID=UPI003159025D
MKAKGPHEFAGPCPECGGEDRFIVWPDKPNGGGYWCRGCGRQGDAIQYQCCPVKHP